MVKGLFDFCIIMNFLKVIQKTKRKHCFTDVSIIKWPLNGRLARMSRLPYNSRYVFNMHVAHTWDFISQESNSTQTRWWMWHVSHIGLRTLGMPWAADNTAPPPSGTGWAVPRLSSTATLWQISESLPKECSDLLKNQTCSHFQSIWTLRSFLVNSACP